VLLIELISAPEDKSIVVEYCQIISEKILLMPVSMLHTKSITNTCIDTHKVSPILLVAIPVLQY